MTKHECIECECQITVLPQIMAQGSIPFKQLFTLVPKWLIVAYMFLVQCFENDTIEAYVVLRVKVVNRTQ